MPHLLRHLPHPPSGVGLFLLALGLLAGLGTACSKKPRESVSRGDGPAAAPTASPASASSPTADGSAQPPTEARLDGSGDGALGGVRALDGPGILAEIRSTNASFTLVNFWASWCGPCRQEFPMLIGLSANLEARGLRILFVSLDEPESIPAALEFARNNGLAPPIVVAERPISALKAAIHPGWPGMLPASFLFDKNGTMKYFWGGPVYESELLPVLDKALSGQEVSGEMHFGLSPGKDLRHD